MSTRPAPPGLGVVAAGGFGVLVVLAFVAALAFGSTSRSTPGELVRVVRAGDGVAVLAGRCLDQRVRSVTVTAGSTLWRITSRKGSIDRRYVVGEAPLGFTTEVPLAAPLAGEVRAEVTFVRDGVETADARTVDVAELPAESGTLDEGAPACPHDEGPGTTTFLFAVAAAFVVAGYVGMLLRFVKR